MGNQATATTAGVEIRLLAMREVHAGENDRKSFPADEIEDLARSIREHGLAQPITVRPDRRGGYEIVAGERRYRAHETMEATHIPAMVRELDDEAAADIMLTENLTRADLNPLDEAKAYRSRMDRFGYTAAEMARRANVTVARVNSRLALLDLRDDAQHLVTTGQLPLGHAAVMHDLDLNRQGLALRFLAASERMPLIAEFRRFCGELLEQQSQDALFDGDDFLQVQVLERHTNEARSASFAVDERLPEFKVASTFAETMKVYLAQLEGAGCTDAAMAVSTVCAGLAKKGWLL